MRSIGGPFDAADFDPHERSRRAWVRAYAGHGYHPNIRRIFSLEDRLFHGTSLDNVPSILKHRLLPRRTLTLRGFRSEFRKTSPVISKLLEDHVVLSLSPLEWVMTRPRGTSGTSALLVVEPAAVSRQSFSATAVTYFGFEPPGPTRDLGLLQNLVEHAHAAPSAAEIWVPNGVEPVFISEIVVADPKWSQPILRAAAAAGASVVVTVAETF